MKDVVSRWSSPYQKVKRHVCVLSRSLMYSEANRRETFTSWPHAGYRWAQPDPMAQAGFYHQVGGLTSRRLGAPSGWAQRASRVAAGVARLLE